MISLDLTRVKICALPFPNFKNQKIEHPIFHVIEMLA
jgi:hypothetical protein